MAALILVQGALTVRFSVARREREVVIVGLIAGKQRIHAFVADRVKTIRFFVSVGGQYSSMGNHGGGRDTELRETFRQGQISIIYDPR